MISQGTISSLGSRSSQLHQRMLEVDGIDQELQYERVGDMFGAPPSE